MKNYESPNIEIKTVTVSSVMSGSDVVNTIDEDVNVSGLF